VFSHKQAISDVWVYPNLKLGTEKKLKEKPKVGKHGNGGWLLFCEKWKEIYAVM